MLCVVAIAQIQFEFLQIVNGIWLWGMVWWLNGESMLRNLYARRFSFIENSHELCENTELFRYIHVTPVQAENN